MLAPRNLCVPWAASSCAKSNHCPNLTVIISLVWVWVFFFFFFFYVFCHLYVFLETISLALPALKLYGIPWFFSICPLLLTVCIYNSFACTPDDPSLYDMLLFCSCEVWDCFWSLALVNNADMKYFNMCPASFKCCYSLVRMF